MCILSKKQIYVQYIQALNFLFSAVKLTKNADPANYSFTRQGSGSDRLRAFSLSNVTGVGKNIKIFVADNSLSLHADNRKKDILIIGKGQTSGLDDKIVTVQAEAEYLMLV